MFSVDRLTKCRTTSGSDSSGSGSGASARASAGSSSETGRTGTSHVGNFAPLQPGLESSKINSVERTFLIEFSRKVANPRNANEKKRINPASRSEAESQISDLKSQISNLKSHVPLRQSPPSQIRLIDRPPVNRRFPPACQSRPWSVSPSPPRAGSLPTRDTNAPAAGRRRFRPPRPWQATHRRCRPSRERRTL